MTRRHNLLALLAAGAVTVLAIAGFSNAASNAAPVNQTEPKIAGTAQVGQTLTASPGTWSGSPTSFAYQWRRCNAQGNGCANIGGGGRAGHPLPGAAPGGTNPVPPAAEKTAGTRA